MKTEHLCKIWMITNVNLRDERAELYVWSEVDNKPKIHSLQAPKGGFRPAYTNVRDMIFQALKIGAKIAQYIEQISEKC